MVAAMTRWPDELLDRATTRVASVESASDDELVALWVVASRELQQRALVRSLANVPADLAEGIVARLVGGQRTAGSTRAVDVLAPDGRTVQVKSLRRTDPDRNSVATFSSFDFDELIIIVFEWDLSLRVGIRVLAEDLKRHRSELLTGADHNRLTLTRRVCEHRAVQPIPRRELITHHPLQPLVAWEAPRWEPEGWSHDSPLPSARARGNPPS